MLEHVDRCREAERVDAQQGTVRRVGTKHGHIGALTEHMLVLAFGWLDYKERYADGADLVEHLI
ncbi:hypothetical protein D3C72_813840 [compost metagenome]